MVPTWFFLQELNEPSILKALAKATKGVESSQETLTLKESITEPPEVMEIYSNWLTPLMIYIRITGLPEDKINRERLRHRAGQYTIVNGELFW
jgi:hypothetical protein